MDAGLLKHRVTLEREQLTPLAGGSFTRSFAVLAVVWAAIEQVTDRTRTETGQRAVRARFRVTLRAQADLSDADQIRWKGRVLRIISVDLRPEGGGYLSFVAEEEP